MVCVIVFDVGFGDAVHVEVNEGGDMKSFLIDCSYAGRIRRCLDYLYEKRKRIDYVILTHKHSDHIAGIRTVMKDTRFVIRGIIMRRDDITSSVSNSVKELIDIICERGRLGNFEFLDVFDERAKEILNGIDILYPLEDNCTVCEDDLNRNSIVLSLEDDGELFMFMGDATTKEEKVIIEQNAIDFSKVKYVKIGHHGSRTATGKYFNDAIGVEGKKCGVVSCKYSKTPPPHEDIKSIWEGQLVYTEDENGKGDVIIDSLEGVNKLC